MSKEEIHREILEKALRDTWVPSPWRKPLILLLGIFLIVIVLTYFTPELLPYLQGRSATQDFNLQIGHEGKIVFDKTVYEELRTLYRDTQTHEFKACLQGYKENGSYYISSVYLPKVYSASVYHVSSAVCPVDTLIELHSHPPEHCIVSEQDLKSIQAFRKINPEAIGAVMCSEERIGLYS